MALYRIGAKTPQVAASAYVAAEATLIGAVSVGERATILAGAVARADNEPITIDDESNVQEGAVLHADPGFPLRIGRRVTVGHMAMLHGCMVGDGTLIGIKSVILNGTVIGKNCLIGANTLIAEGKTIPDGSMVLGSPGKVVRKLSPEEILRIHETSEHYVANFKRYRANLKAEP